MVRRAQAALRSVEHTSVRQLRVLAAIVFLFAMVIATVAPAVTAPMAFADSSTSSSSSSSSSSVDYATWAEVSKAMDKQLNSGLETYKDGNTAGATSDFMGAYNKIYVASNFTAVVHDTIGADKQGARRQEKEEPGQGQSFMDRRGQRNDPDSRQCIQSLRKG